MDSISRCHFAKTVFCSIAMMYVACVSCSLTPEDKNKLCQDYDKTTVYEEALDMCISCFSCDAASQDDHCITCRNLGIIPGRTTSGPSPPGKTSRGFTEPAEEEGRVKSPDSLPSDFSTTSVPDSRAVDARNLTVISNKPSKGNPSDVGTPDFGLFFAIIGTAIGVPVLALWAWANLKFENRQNLPQQETEEKSVFLFPSSAQPQQETGLPGESPPTYYLAAGAVPSLNVHVHNFYETLV